MSSFAELAEKRRRESVGSNADAVSIVAPSRSTAESTSFVEIARRRRESATSTFTTSDATESVLPTSDIIAPDPALVPPYGRFQEAAAAGTTWTPNAEAAPSAPGAEPWYGSEPVDDSDVELGADVKSYNLPPAPEMTAADKAWAGNRKYQPHGKGIKNQYFQSLTDEEYANVLEAGKSLSEIEQQAENPDAFYRSLSKEHQLALDAYNAAPKGWAAKNAAAFATGVGRSVPLSRVIAPETAAERKQAAENPVGNIAGSVAGNVGSLLTAGGGVAKGIMSIPKVGAAIAKSPIGKQAAIRGTTGALMGAGQTVGQEGTTAKDIALNAALGAAGGMISIAPEIAAPAGAWQIPAQLLVDLGYDAATDKWIRKVEDIGSKDWWLNEIPAMFISGGFGIKDAASGQTFRLEQAAQRAELGKIKTKIRGWRRKNKGPYEIVPPEAEAQAQAGQEPVDVSKTEIPTEPTVSKTETVTDGAETQGKGGTIDENAQRATEVPRETNVEPTRVFEGETAKPETDVETDAAKPNEKRERFDALPPSEVNDSEIRALQVAAASEPDGKTFTSRVFEWLRSKNVLGTHVNAEKGWEVEVNNKSVRSVISHGGKSGKVSLLEAVPNLIKNGVYLETIPKNDKGLITHVFAGKATITDVKGNNTPYAVSFAVREDMNGRRYYDHSLTKIDALDRIDGQAQEPASEPQKRIGARSYTSDGKPAGERTLSNILKENIGVNSKSKKNEKTSTAPNPDAVKYNKRTAKVFKELVIIQDANGQKYISTSHFAKPTTDAEIKFLSEALGIEPVISFPKRPQVSYEEILKTHIENATVKLDEPQVGTNDRYGQILRFDSPEGTTVVSKEYADFFNQQGNRFYIQPTASKSEFQKEYPSLVVKDADGRIAGVIMGIRNDQPIEDFSPLPNYFSHGETSAKGTGKPEPEAASKSEPEPAPKGRKPKGEKIDPDDIDWGSPGRNKKGERIYTVVYKNRKFTAKQPRNTDPYRVFETVGKEEKFLFQADTESDAEAELVKHLEATREQTREIPRHNNKVDAIDLGYEDAMPGVSYGGYDHAGADYNKADFAEGVRSETDYNALKEKINETKDDVPKEKIEMYQEGIKYGDAEDKLLGLLDKSGKKILKSNEGEEARLSKSSIGKLISNAAVKKSMENGFTREQHYAVAADIRDLYENSTKLLEHPDKNGNPDIAGMHRYASPLFGDNVAYITVKEATVHGKRIYSIEVVEIGKLEGILEEAMLSTPDNTTTFPTSSLPKDDNKISDSPEKVNSKSEKNKKNISDTPKPAPLTPRQFKKLLDRLARTGLAKDVITDADAMRKRLSRGFGGEAADRFMSLWHGSPHAFDKFSTAYMGTGEGEQAYGWGLYFTDKETIAKGYAEKLADRRLGIYNPNFELSTWDGIPLSNILRDNYDKFFIASLEKSRNTNEFRNSVDLAYRDIRLKKPKGFEKQRKLILNAIDGGKIKVAEVKPESNLYNVKIHGDKTADELNFIRWDKPLTEEQLQQIAKQAEKEGYGDARLSHRDESGNLYFSGGNRDGEFLYKNEFVRVLGSPKAASEFLLRAGIDGIQFPTEYRSKGSHEDAYNYVVFDDKAIEIAEHIRLMSTPDGEVYGFATRDGKIYLDPDKMNANTPIHEYGHLWTDFVKAHNKPLYDRLTAAATRSEYYKELKDNPKYSNLSRADRAEEALARAIADAGEARFTNEGGFERFRELVRNLWSWVARRFGLARESGLSRADAKDVENMTLAELAEGGARELLGGERIGEGDEGGNYIRGDNSRNRGQGEVIKEYVPDESDIRKSREGLVQAKPVADLTGKEFEKGEKNLFEQVSDYFDSVGNSAHNEELGDIGLTRSGVRNDIAHGVGRLKAVTFAAVPDVLKDGKIISYTENHKGRGYDSAIIAAPVNINGRRYHVAAVVNRNRVKSGRTTSQQFYLHEVYTNKNASELFKSVAHLLQGVEQSNSDAQHHTNKISDSPEKVNTHDKKNKQTSNSDASKGDYAENSPPDAVGETSGLRPVELPELIQTVEAILGKVPTVKSTLKDGARGAAIRNADGEWVDIQLAADLPKDPNQATKTLAHEIGHVLSKFGGDGKYKAIAQKIKNVEETLKQFIENDPAAENLTDKDRKRIRREVENLLKKGVKYIDDVITKETPYTPEDILAVWNSVDPSKVHAELEDYIKGLDAAEKKSVVMAAIKGSVPPDVPTRTETVTTGRKIQETATPEAIARDYLEAILKEADARRLTELKTIYEELFDLSKEWRPFDESTATPKDLAYRQRGEEVFADAISVYLHDPDLLMQRAPNFWRVFHGWEDSRNPFTAVHKEIQKLYGQGEAEIFKHRKATMEEAREQERLALEKERKTKLEAAKRDNSFSKFWSWLARTIWDEDTELGKLVKNAKKLGSKIEGRVDPYLNKKMERYLDSYKTAFELDVKNELRNILGDLDGKTIADLGDYMTFNRIANGDRNQLFNPHGHTPETAAKMLDGYKKEWGEERFNAIKKAAEKYAELRDEYIIPIIKESGMFSDKFIEKVVKNKAYATFKILDKIAEEHGTRMLKKMTGDGKPTGAHAQKGTVRATGNAFLATLENDMRMLTYIDKNNLVKNSVKILTDSKNSLGYYAEAIRRGDNAAQGTATIDGSGHTLRAVFYFENGQRKGYYVSEEIARSLINKPRETNFALKALQGIGDFYRNIFTQKNPAFWVWNVQRDFRSFHRNIKQDNVFQKAGTWWGARKEIVQYLRDGKMTDDVRNALKERAMLARSAYSKEDLFQRWDDKFDEMVNGLSEQGKLAKTGRLLGRAGAKLDYINDVLELTTKLAGYKTLKKVEGMSAEERAQLIRTRVGTPDVHAGGTITRWTNKLFLFSNMRIQGLRESINVFRENPKRSLLMFAMYDFAPAALVAAAKHGLLSQWTNAAEDNELLPEGSGKVAEWLENAYNKIPSWDKIYRNAIPLPFETESGKQVYFVFPHSEMGATLSGISYIMADNMISAGKDIYAAATESDAKRELTGEKGVESVQQAAGLLTMDQAPFAPSTILPAIQAATGLMTWFFLGQNPVDWYKFGQGGYNQVLRGQYRADMGKANIDVLKWTANKAGASVVYKIKDKDVDPDNENWLEKALGLPVVGNPLGRFVRVSDKGLEETERETKAQKTLDKKRKKLKANKANNKTKD